MQLVTPPGALRQFMRFYVHLKLPLYLRCTLILCTCTAVLVAGPVVLMRHNPLRNPFALYARLFPGQSAAAVTRWPFVCRFTPTESPSPADIETCVLNPPDGPFSEVYVIILGQLINQTGFEVRGKELSLGDLVMLWGQPEIHWMKMMHGHVVSLTWATTGAASSVLSDSIRIDSMLPMRSVAFFGSGQNGLGQRDTPDGWLNQ